MNNSERGAELLSRARRILDADLESHNQARWSRLAGLGSDRTNLHQAIGGKIARVLWRKTLWKGRGGGIPQAGGLRGSIRREDAGSMNWMRTASSFSGPRRNALAAGERYLAHLVLETSL